MTNALDGSDDYLVSDRIFSMVGDSMRGFRSEMLKEPCPKTLVEVVRKLIPPKGIKRKHTEGYELFEGDEIERETGIEAGEDADS